MDKKNHQHAGFTALVIHCFCDLENQLPTGKSQVMFDGKWLTARNNCIVCQDQYVIRIYWMFV